MHWNMERKSHKAYYGLQKNRQSGWRKANELRAEGWGPSAENLIGKLKCRWFNVCMSVRCLVWNGWGWFSFRVSIFVLHTTSATKGPTYIVKRERHRAIKRVDYFKYLDWSWVFFLFRIAQVLEADYSVFNYMHTRGDEGCGMLVD